MHFELFGQQMTQAAKQEDGERMSSLFRKILEEIEVLDK